MAVGLLALVPVLSYAAVSLEGAVTSAINVLIIIAVLFVLTRPVASTHATHG